MEESIINRNEVTIYHAGDKIWSLNPRTDEGADCDVRTGTLHLDKVPISETSSSAE